MNGSVRLHIERLVIDGAPGVQGDRLVEAIVDELRRLAVASAPPFETDGEVEADLEQSPVTAGRAIAAVIHSRLIAEAGHG